MNAVAVSCCWTLTWVSELLSIQDFSYSLLTFLFFITVCLRFSSLEAKLKKVHSYARAKIFRKNPAKE